MRCDRWGRGDGLVKLVAKSMVRGRHLGSVVWDGMLCRRWKRCVVVLWVGC